MSCQCLKSCHQEGALGLKGLLLAASQLASTSWKSGRERVGVDAGIIRKRGFARVIGLPLLTFPVHLKSAGGWSNLEESFLGQGRLSSEESWRLPRHPHC